MTKFTWILYLVATALVFASWMGLVSPEVGWIGWTLATVVALQSWFRGTCGTGCCRPKASEAGSTSSGATTFTAEEVEAARREVHGEEPEPAARQAEAGAEEPAASQAEAGVEEPEPKAAPAQAPVTEPGDPHRGGAPEEAP